MIRPIDNFDGISINLEVSSLCNFHCPYCYERKKALYCRFFSTHELQKINSALAKSFYKIRLYILGGEPYLYPYLDDAIKLFRKNEKIHEIIIYSNGSFPERLVNCKHFLSFHRSQDNSNFFLSCKKLKGTGSAIKLLLDNPNDLIDTEQQLKQTGLPVLPTYLYRPDKEFSENTKRLKLHPKILECEDVPEFIWDDKKVSRRYVIEHLDTTHVRCAQTRFCINNIGNICVGCGPAIDNIFKNQDFFNNYRISTIKCRCFTCSKDMFLEQPKYSTISALNILKSIL